MLEDGLSYPFRGDSALGRFVIGGLLSFGTILVLPAVFLVGYLQRVLGSAARDEREPPAFDDWGGMLVDGLKATAVVVVYGFVPFLLVFGTVGLSLAGAASGGDAGGVLGGIGVLGTLASLVGLLMAYYLIPAALTNVALEGRIGAAFDVDRMTSVLLSGDYLLAWLVPVLIGIVVNAVTIALAVTVIGLLVVPLVQFYVQVAIFYMFGRAFGQTVGAGPDSRTVAATTAAE